MCGITGWTGRTPGPDDASTLEALCRALGHRGPDGEGRFLSASAGVGLGHRRLAILDLSAASAQPMIDAESGVALTYNGELYNFRELRAQLEAKGHRFRSTGDVEVVLRCFLEWGEGCFERFCGMFALALWDPRQRTLWLARDALGMKPLYLWRPPSGGLVFASEARALAAHPELELRVRRDALARYLEFGFQIEERTTIFAGIERLAPGEVLGVRNGEVIRRFRHFTPPRPDREDRRGEAERVEELDAVLSRVVREHLVADVPVGILLSGGLDSSLVAALAARDGELTTVSMGFARSRHDEREWAAGVAAHVGSRHHELLIEPDEVLAELETCAGAFDDLFADWGTVTTRILYRRSRELGLKVVLVGEGADELFGGYPVFEVPEAATSEGRVFGLYRRYATRRWGWSYPAFRRVFRALIDEAGGDLFHAIRLFEACRQLPGNYVMKVDKASMSVSVEARAPYLDRRVAEVAFKTPREWLLRNGENKFLLRAVAARRALLPEAIAGRAKQGGSIAFSWLEGVPSFREAARQRILRAGGWAEEVGLRPAMERYFAGRRGDPPPRALSLFGHLAWRLFLLEHWAAALGMTRPSVSGG